jgi:hypothetical protein
MDKSRIYQLELQCREYVKKHKGFLSRIISFKDISKKFNLKSIKNIQLKNKGMLITLSTIFSFILVIGFLTLIDFKFNFSIDWFDNKEVVIHFNDSNNSKTDLSNNHVFFNGGLIFEVIDYDYIKFVNDMEDIDSLDRDIDFKKHILLDYGEYVDNEMNKQNNFINNLENSPEEIIVYMNCSSPQNTSISFDDNKTISQNNNQEKTSWDEIYIFDKDFFKNRELVDSMNDSEQLLKTSTNQEVNIKRKSSSEQIEIPKIEKIPVSSLVVVNEPEEEEKKKLIAKKEEAKKLEIPKIEKIPASSLVVVNEPEEVEKKKLIAEQKESKKLEIPKIEKIPVSSLVVVNEPEEVEKKKLIAKKEEAKKIEIPKIAAIKPNNLVVIENKKQTKKLKNSKKDNIISKSDEVWDEFYIFDQNFFDKKTLIEDLKKVFKKDENNTQKIAKKRINKLPKIPTIQVSRLIEDAKNETIARYKKEVIARKDEPKKIKPVIPKFKPIKVTKLILEDEDEISETNNSHINNNAKQDKIAQTEKPKLPALKLENVIFNDETNENDLPKNDLEALAMNDETDTSNSLQKQLPKISPLALHSIIVVDKPEENITDEVVAVEEHNQTPQFNFKDKEPHKIVLDEAKKEQLPIIASWEDFSLFEDKDANKTKIVLPKHKIRNSDIERPKPKISKISSKPVSSFKYIFQPNEFGDISSIKLEEPEDFRTEVKKIVIKKDGKEEKQEKELEKQKKNKIDSTVINLDALEKPKLVEKTQAVEKPKPVEKTQAVEKPKPVEKTQAVEKPKLVEKTQAVEKPKPVEKTQVVEKPKPESAEKIKIIKRPKPIKIKRTKIIEESPVKEFEFVREPKKNRRQNSKYHTIFFEPIIIFY